VSIIFEEELTDEEKLLPQLKTYPPNLYTFTQLKKLDLTTDEEAVAVFCNGIHRTLLFDIEKAEPVDNCDYGKVLSFTKDNLMKSLKRIRVSKQGYLKFIHPKKLNRYEKKMVKLEYLEHKVLEKFTQDKVEVFDIEFKRLRLMDAVATLNAYAESLEI